MSNTDSAALFKATLTGLVAKFLHERFSGQDAPPASEEAVRSLITPMVEEIVVDQIPKLQAMQISGMTESTARQIKEAGSDLDKLHAALEAAGAQVAERLKFQNAPRKDAAPSTKILNMPWSAFNRLVPVVPSPIPDKYPNFTALLAFLEKDPPENITRLIARLDEGSYHRPSAALLQLAHYLDIPLPGAPSSAATDALLANPDTPLKDLDHFAPVKLPVAALGLYALHKKGKTLVVMKTARRRERTSFLAKITLGIFRKSLGMPEHVDNLDRRALLERLDEGVHTISGLSRRTPGIGENRAALTVFFLYPGLRISVESSVPKFVMPPTRSAQLRADEDRTPRKNP